MGRSEPAHVLRGLMRIDAHTHIWKSTSNPVARHTTAVSSESDVPGELLLAYMDEHGVDRAVLVQPLFPGQDNNYVADQARAHPDRFAAVCVVDPRNPHFHETLKYWVEKRGCKGLRLRPLIAGEESPFEDSASADVWESIAALRTVVNVLVAARQLPLLESWAQRFPEVPVLVDHMGFPGSVPETSESDWESLKRLARCTNVLLKISGFYYCSRQPYPYADCWDLFRAIFDVWGPHRLIWGSDFPHVLLKTEYRRAVMFLERFFSFLSSNDIDLIMGANAERLYWKRAS